MLMESILQNVDASFDNSIGFKLGLSILMKFAFVTFQTACDVFMITMFIVH